MQVFSQRSFSRFRGTNHAKGIPFTSAKTLDQWIMKVHFKTPYQMKDDYHSDKKPEGWTNSGKITAGFDGGEKLEKSFCLLAGEGKTAAETKKPCHIGGAMSVCPRISPICWSTAVLYSLRCQSWITCTYHSNKIFPNGWWFFSSAPRPQCTHGIYCVL